VSGATTNPSPSARLAVMLRWPRPILLVPAGLVAWTILQVLLARFIQPATTLTVVQRAWEHAVSGEGLAWPHRRVRSLERIGPRVARAVLASEDAKFYLHGGFDWDSVCHAMTESRGQTRGASTITQQVAKNVFLWQRRSWVRKGLEVWYTFLLELLLPKDRILELYLNSAETGPMVFGMESGAQHHFGVSAGRLTADQAGRLAAILPNPQDWSVNGALAAERSAWIAAHPAPMPGDAHWKVVLADWQSRWHTPWSCL
jgi:monofunctional glycosyltransferase